MNAERIKTQPTMTDYQFITINTFPIEQAHNLNCLSRWGTEIPLRKSLVSHRCGFLTREVVKIRTAQNKAFTLKVGLQQACTLPDKRDDHDLQDTQSATTKSNSEWQ